MYSFHLFLNSSASIIYLPFLSFIVPIFGWNAPLMFLVFLKRSLVFPPLLSSSIIKHCSLKKAFLSLLALLWNFAFNWIYLSLPLLLFASFHSSALCKASSDNHFAVSIFFFLIFGMVFFTAFCTMLQTSQMVKNLPAMQETWVWSLGREDPLEKEMVTHFSILAWKILWTEELGGLQSMVLQGVGHNWATFTSLHFTVN